MRSGPTVSAVIPVYNCEAYLAEAVESALSQTLPPSEIIVVDDGSTDRTAEVANRFGDQIRYAYQANQGIGAARNHGVDLARGDLVAFLDADDVWLPEKLALQTAALTSDPRLDMVLGHVEQFVSPELDAARARGLEPAEAILPGYVAGTVLVRRDSFFRAGPFATRWRVGEFVDWYARAKDAGLEDLMLPNVVTRRRIHTANVSVRERDARSDFVSILKSTLDRRRRTGRGLTGGMDDETVK